LDTSVVAFDREGKVVDAVHYAKLTALGGLLKHHGDNRTGEGKGDDEEVDIDLTHVRTNIASFAVIVTSFSGQTFDNVKSAYVRIKENHRTLVLARLHDLPKCTGNFNISFKKKKKKKEETPTKMI
jgi:tellurium resistance protein TerZ